MYYYDLTRDEMLALVKKTYPEADEFDIEEAIYWFASDYHGGQWTNLYSVLCNSQFNPGILSSSVREGAAQKIYQFLEQKYGK